MKHFLALTITLFCVFSSLNAQVDSFSVNGYNFRYQIPEGWTFVSKDNGICEYDETNVRMEMPLKSKKYFGSLMISISEITDAERKRRSIEDETEDPLKLDNTSFEIEYSGFHTAGGYYDARPDDDTLYYADSRGALVVTKKKSKNKKWVEVHRYARWSYFPVNDSLEILIYFQGFIPHNEESNADAATINLAKFFYANNKNTLDSLLKNTSPFRNEPEFLPLDSMTFMNVFLKYPLLPGWTYDTTSTRDNESLVLLRLKPAMPDSCDNGYIKVSYRITPVDPKKNVHKEYIEAVEEFLPAKMAREAIAKATDTTGFSKQKQHYYFSQESTNDTKGNCTELTRYFESLHIFIYTQPTERISLTIDFMGTTTNDKRRMWYFHDYYRFIYNFVVANDFEKIYLLNKADAK